MMKVKELIEKLNEYNQDADVEICVDGMRHKNLKYVMEIPKGAQNQDVKGLLLWLE